jgi:hypothetical protein
MAKPPVAKSLLPVDSRIATMAFGTATNGGTRSCARLQDKPDGTIYVEAALRSHRGDYLAPRHTPSETLTTPSKYRSLTTIALRKRNLHLILPRKMYNPHP